MLLNHWRHLLLDRQGAATTEVAESVESAAKFCESAADSPCSSRTDRIALHRPMAAMATTARRGRVMLISEILFGDKEEEDMPGW